MTSALEGGEGSASRPSRTLPEGKTRFPLYRRLGGPQGRSGQVRKISPPPGFDPRTVQTVGSRYTDYATRPLYITYVQLSLTSVQSHGVLTGTALLIYACVNIEDIEYSRRNIRQCFCWLQLRSCRKKGTAAKLLSYRTGYFKALSLFPVTADSNIQLDRTKGTHY